ncbi:hypothetical protein Ccrd_008404 [Cynara cardunculus var. scolymus]|uniref:Uncharacterized protein n=1 Tax=Cynara cardunculus var. scolymus TaxID=59895 RepID=A0A103XFA5_CYNCS|nr:hypothetical protein Ccrd_008404 [Cynara cardunculus var. scolymus]
MGIARFLLLFIATFVAFITETYAMRSLEGELILVVEPSQPPDSSVSGSLFPGIKRIPLHHKSNKSIAGADLILGGYVMACVVAVLLYIRVTRRTSDTHSQY